MDLQGWLGGVVFPLYERARGRATPRLEDELSASQWWPRDRLEDRSWEELERLLTHAVAKVPFYRRWSRESGLAPRDIVAERDLSGLPIVDKAARMDNPDDFNAAPQPPGSFTKVTGGSTGRPLALRVDPGSDQWRQAVSRRGYRWAGCSRGVRQLHFWGGDLLPVTPYQRLKKRLAAWVSNQRTVDCFNLTEAKLAATLDLVDQWQPRAIVAYATPLYELASYAQGQGWRPRRPPQGLISGAEALHPHQREVIEAAFQAPVFETYGSREFMLIAGECERHQGLHVSAENLVVEILRDGEPCPPGQVGEVVVTDLHNLAQPFIRYRSGDLAAWAEEPCPCGRGFPCLERIEGRILDALRAPGGEILAGEFFPHLLKDFPAIESFQVVQESPSRLVIKVVLKGTLADPDRELILGKVAAALPGVAAEFEAVDQIPLTPAGKRRVTIGLGQAW